MWSFCVGKWSPMKKQPGSPSRSYFVIMQKNLGVRGTLSSVTWSSNAKTLSETTPTSFAAALVNLARNSMVRYCSRFLGCNNFVLTLRTTASHLTSLHGIFKAYISLIGFVIHDCSKLHWFGFVCRVFLHQILKCFFQCLLFSLSFKDKSPWKTFQKALCCWKPCLQLLKTSEFRR